jgi:hypothetical protein
MVKSSRYMLALGVLALGFISVGCQSDKITAASVRANPSPDLTSVALNREQMDNRSARAMDTTMRQVWDDFDAIMFLDKPMRLTKYPIR